MTQLGQDKLVFLEQTLEKEYFPTLPPLLDTKKPLEEQRRKNLSRALSAFVLHSVTGISSSEAAKAVVDDFDDSGIDIIYYYTPTETLYIIQSKMKEGAQFKQPEALAYCQGIRRLIMQDFSGFNKNVLDRKVEIEDALENCNHIQLVVGHIGTGLSEHAKVAICDLLNDEDQGEERLEKQIIDFDWKLVDCTPMIGQKRLGESGGILR